MTKGSKSNKVLIFLLAENGMKFTGLSKISCCLKPIPNGKVIGWNKYFEINFCPTFISDSKWKVSVLGN